MGRPDVVSVEPFIPPEARPEVMDELAVEAWEVARALLALAGEETV